MQPLDLIVIVVTWATGIFWLGVVARRDLGRGVLRPVPLVNLLLWPISLPLWFLLGRRKKATRGRTAR